MNESPLREEIEKILGHCIGHGYNDAKRDLSAPDDECIQFAKEQLETLCSLLHTELRGVMPSRKKLTVETNIKGYYGKMMLMDGYNEAIFDCLSALDAVLEVKV